MAAGNLSLLRELVARTGAGDQRAFREIYGLLAPTVLPVIRRSVPGPAESAYLLDATFIEVRWMARQYGRSQGEVSVWVEAIAVSRVAEHCRVLGIVGGRATSVRAEYDRHLHCELRRLLGVWGPGPRSSTTAGGPDRPRPPRSNPRCEIW